MAASRFSCHVLELFFGSIPEEKNQTQKRPIFYRSIVNRFNILFLFLFCKTL